MDWAPWLGIALVLLGVWLHGNFAFAYEKMVGPRMPWELIHAVMQDPERDFSIDDNEARLVLMQFAHEMSRDLLDARAEPDTIEEAIVRLRRVHIALVKGTWECVR